MGAEVYELLAPRRPGEHVWLEFDANHRGCQQCGLRLFYREHPTRGWVMVDYWGVPRGNLLGAGVGGFGECKPPSSPGPAVLIDYTGDPDIHYGCERFMHRIADPPRTAPASSSAGGLVLLGSVRPACGYVPRYWEIGPARDHVGWTWCADCFDGHQGAQRRSGARRLEAPKGEAIVRAPTPRPPFRSYLPPDDPPRIGPGGSTRRKRT